jgi:hypothetical protein
MAEDIFYWICSCGKSNLKSSNRCSTCQKRRSRRWIFYVSVAAISIAAIAIFSSPPPSSNDGRSRLPTTQRDFLYQISEAKKSSKTASNALAFSEILDLRDKQLSDLSAVSGWSGVVLGVQRMQGKGAISIDAGGATVLAGVHLTYGLDTLIPPSKKDIYSVLLKLKDGDAVTFSGRFSVHNGSIVEMSYTGSGSVSEPEFLFEFSDLARSVKSDASVK